MIDIKIVGLENGEFVTSAGFVSEPGPKYVLPCSALLEIHDLVGMVCGSRMNLPVKMLRKAHQVHAMMIALNQIEVEKPLAHEVIRG